MARCRKKRFDKVTICAGDLRHRTDIVERTLGTPAPGQSNPPITYTPVLTAEPTGIETVSGTARFDGVNIEDRPTHIFTYRAQSVTVLLEHGNNFIRLGNRVFRALEIRNNDEDDSFVDVTATERGVETQAGSEA